MAGSRFASRRSASVAAASLVHLRHLRHGTLFGRSNVPAPGTVGSAQIASAYDTTLEKLANKAAASGYGSLDAGSLLVQAVKLVQSGAAGIGAGAVGLSGGLLTFGDGSAQQTAEAQKNKSSASGYGALDASQLVSQAAKLVRVGSPAAVQGEIGMSSSNLLWHDGSVQQTAERLSHKNGASGYAGLDANGKVAAATLAVGAAVACYVFGTSDNPTANGTFFLPPSGGHQASAALTEAQAANPFTRAGQTANLHVINVSATGVGSSTTFTGRVAGADTALTLTVGGSVAAGTVTTDLTHTVAVTRGQTHALKIATNGTAPGSRFIASYDFQPT